jgi:transcriptional regulator with XRE-family HTH domain
VMNYEELRRRRIAVHMTQAQLATRVGLSTGYINLLERGERNGTIETQEKIKEVLTAAFDELKERGVKWSIDEPKRKPRTYPITVSAGRIKGPMIILVSADPFYSGWWRALAQEASEQVNADPSMMLVQAYHWESMGRAFDQLTRYWCLRSKLGGIIIAPPFGVGDVDRGIATRLWQLVADYHKMGTHVVSIDREVPREARIQIPLYKLNDEHAGQKAAKALIGKGHRKIAVLIDFESQTTSSGRLKGVRDEVDAHNNRTPDNTESQVELETYQGSLYSADKPFGTFALSGEVPRLVAREPSGIIATSDHVIPPIRRAIADHNDQREKGERYYPSIVCCDAGPETYPDEGGDWAVSYVDYRPQQLVSKALSAIMNYPKDFTPDRLEPAFIEKKTLEINWKRKQVG